MRSGHQGSRAPVCKGGAWMVGWGAVDGEDSDTVGSRGSRISRLASNAHLATYCVCVA